MTPVNITKRDINRHVGPLMEVRISVTKSSCQKVDSEFNQASSSNKQVTANTGDSKHTEFPFWPTLLTSTQTSNK